MKITWYSPEPPPDLPAPRGLAWLRVVRRGLGVMLLLLLLLPALFAARGIDTVRHGRRPLSPRIMQAFGAGCLRAIGLPLTVKGRPDGAAGAVVSNHTGWLDILVLAAALPVTFVSKDAVAGWPVIGPLARWTGTLFIARDRRQAPQQAERLAERLRAGSRMLFFPEGTSTDGRRVVRFHAPLFGGLLAAAGDTPFRVQPVSVVLHGPGGADPRFYAWWGDTELAPHLLAVLARRRHGRVTVVLHPPVETVPGEDRKALAGRLETIVRAGVAAELGLPPADH
jgi:1-acyl-sn-glycerol-3-phosphate acyltransferase